MSRDWSGVVVLVTMKDVRAYLVDRHGLSFSIRTLYRYAGDDFMPLPIAPSKSGRRGPLERVPAAAVDDWVAGRFHLRRAPA